MGTFEFYLWKSVVTLSLLYCFYWFILRNETYYAWNRLFLVVSLIISFLFPMLRFSVQDIPAGTFTSTINPIIMNGYITTTKPIQSLDILSILSVIYISGAVFFCLRFLLSLARIHFLYYRFPKYTYHGFKAVVLDNDQSPFTFFNILFIARIDFEGNGTDEMIAHEQAHKEAYHTFDILLLEAMTIIQWFNPFIWMYRQSLKSEHEFIADHKVLGKGFDKVKYQKLLFERSLGITSFNLTNNFNYSLLKKRLKMMTMSKSSAWIKIKYLLSLPILLFTMVLLSINFTAYGQKDKIYAIVDVQPKYNNGGDEEIRKFIAQHILYPKSAVEKNIAAKIYVQFVVDEKGAVSDVQTIRSDIMDKAGKEVVVVGYKTNENPAIDSKSVADLEAESIRVIKLLERFTPAQKDGKNVKTQLTIPILFALENKKR